MQPRIPAKFAFASVQYQAQDPQLAEVQAQLLQMSTLFLQLDHLSRQHFQPVLPFELPPSVPLIQTLQQPDFYKIWANMPGRGFENDVINQWYHQLLHVAQDKYPRVLAHYCANSSISDVKSPQAKIEHLLQLLRAYEHEMVDYRRVEPEETLKAIMQQNWEKFLSQILEQYIANQMNQLLPTVLPDSFQTERRELAFWPVVAVSHSTLNFETRTRTLLKPLSRDDYRFYKENHSSPQDEIYHVGVWTVTTLDKDNVRSLIEFDAQGQAFFQECILTSQHPLITHKGEHSELPIPPQYLSLLHVDGMGLLSYRFSEPFGTWLRGQRSRAKLSKKMLLVGGFADIEQILRKKIHD
jgi:hypothetical protein